MSVYEDQLGRVGERSGDVSEPIDHQSTVGTDFGLTLGLTLAGDLCPEEGRQTTRWVRSCCRPTTLEKRSRFKIQDSNN